MLFIRKYLGIVTALNLKKDIHSIHAVYTFRESN
jgi:hypothetical protein